MRGDSFVLYRSTLYHVSSRPPGFAVIAAIVAWLRSPAELVEVLS
jgi:hypothetical protein